MHDTSKKLVSHGSIYFVGNILRYCVSFIMLPIYTRVLTPADYGILELLSMVIDFAGIVFGLRIGEAIFRFYMLAEDDFARKQIVSSSLILTTVLNSCGFLVLYSLSGYLSTSILGGLEQQNLLILFSLSLLFQPLIEIPMTFIRALQRPWLFVTFSMIKLILQLTLNIYLVVMLDMGVRGVVLSAVISGAIMALLLGGYCLSKTGLHFSFSLSKTLLVFSYPLVLTGLISFYVTFGDRYFLKYYGTLTDVGLYALGYKFGFLLNFIGTGPFFSIWDAERYNVLKTSDAKKTFQDVFILFNVFTLIIVVGIAVFSRNILIIMSNPVFWGAANIVPIILVAYYFQGLIGYCNFGILIHKKTLIITKSVLLAAVLITALYFLLIPQFGALGAAWATTLAFAVRFLYIYHHATALFDMELPWRKLYILFAPSLGTMLLALFVPDQILLKTILNIIIFFSFIYTITLLPILSKGQRGLLRSLLIRPWCFAREIRKLTQNG